MILFESGNKKTNCYLVSRAASPWAQAETNQIQVKPRKDKQQLSKIKGFREKKREIKSPKN